ncbi:MAG: LysM peptidoglycan-binding domain-containing protein [Oligoflexales bacterium]|nr:LysM peptidoglycan-binding domain-containing protein [Oligoflexales bacterium]
MNIQLKEEIKRNFCAVLAAFTAFSSPSFGERYSVKKGDTLSQIVSKKLGKPVYGKKGKLGKVIRLNPDINNPDLIYPNDIIILSNEDETKAKAAPGISGGKPAAENIPKVVEPENSTVAPHEKTADLPSGAPAGKNTNRISAEFINSFSTITADSKDGVFATRLRSNDSLGLKVTFSHEWNENWNTSLFVEGLRSSFNDTIDNRLEGPEHPLKAFGLSARYRLSDNLAVIGQTESRQHFFIVAKSASQLTLTPVFIDSYGLKIENVFMRGDRYKIGHMAGVSELSVGEGEGTRIDNGYSGDYALFTELSLTDDWSFSGKMFGIYRKQNSREVNQTDREIGFSIGIGRGF